MSAMENAREDEKGALLPLLDLPEDLPMSEREKESKTGRAGASENIQVPTTSQETATPTLPAPQVSPSTIQLPSNPTQTPSSATQVPATTKATKRKTTHVDPKDENVATPQDVPRKRGRKPKPKPVQSPAASTRKEVAPSTPIPPQHPVADVQIATPVTPIALPQQVASIAPNVFTPLYAAAAAIQTTTRGPVFDMQQVNVASSNQKQSIVPSAGISVEQKAVAATHIPTQLTTEEHDVATHNTTPDLPVALPTLVAQIAPKISPSNIETAETTSSNVLFAPQTAARESTPPSTSQPGISTRRTPRKVRSQSIERPIGIATFTSQAELDYAAGVPGIYLDLPGMKNPNVVNTKKKNVTRMITFKSSSLPTEGHLKDNSEATREYFLGLMAKDEESMKKTVPQVKPGRNPNPKKRKPKNLPISMTESQPTVLQNTETGAWDCAPATLPFPQPSKKRKKKVEKSQQMSETPQADPTVSESQPAELQNTETGAWGCAPAILSFPQPPKKEVEESQGESETPQADLNTPKSQPTVLQNVETGAWDCSPAILPFYQPSEKTAEKAQSVSEAPQLDLTLPSQLSSDISSNPQASNTPTGSSTNMVSDLPSESIEHGEATAHAVASKKRARKPSKLSKPAGVTKAVKKKGKTSHTASLVAAAETQTISVDQQTASSFQAANATSVLAHPPHQPNAASSAPVSNLGLGGHQVPRTSNLQPSNPSLPQLPYGNQFGHPAPQFAAVPDSTTAKHLYGNQFGPSKPLPTLSPAIAASIYGAQFGSRSPSFGATHHVPNFAAQPYPLQYGGTSNNGQYSSLYRPQTSLQSAPQPPLHYQPPVSAPTPVQSSTYQSLYEQQPAVSRFQPEPQTTLQAPVENLAPVHLPAQTPGQDGTYRSPYEQGDTASRVQREPQTTLQASFENLAPVDLPATHIQSPMAPIEEGPSTISQEDEELPIVQSAVERLEASVTQGPPSQSIEPSQLPSTTTLEEGESSDLNSTEQTEELAKATARPRRKTKTPPTYALELPAGDVPQSRANAATAADDDDDFESDGAYQPPVIEPVTKGRKSRKRKDPSNSLDTEVPRRLTGRATLSTRRSQTPSQQATKENAKPASKTTGKEPVVDREDADLLRSAEEASVDDDNLTHLACIYERYAGNLVLSKDNSTLTFLRVTERPEDSLFLTLSVTDIKDNPITSARKSNPMQLIIKIANPEQEDGDLISHSFVYGSYKSSTQAATTMRLKIINAMDLTRLRTGVGYVRPSDLKEQLEKPYSCAICRNRFKNANGLQYHQQKSNTDCNPNYDATKVPPKRGRKKQAKTVKPEEADEPEIDKDYIEEVEEVEKVRRPRKSKKARTETVVREPSPDSEASVLEWAESVAVGPVQPAKPARIYKAYNKEKPLLADLLKAYLEKQNGEQAPQPLAAPTMFQTELPSLTTLAEQVPSGHFMTDGIGKQMILLLLNANNGVLPGFKSVWAASIGLWLSRPQEAKVLPPSATINRLIDDLVDEGKLCKETFKYVGKRARKLDEFFILVPGVDTSSDRCKMLIKCVEKCTPDIYVPSHLAPPQEFMV